MNLYLISQDVNDDYDTYDSAVVVAADEDTARCVSPSDFYVWRDEGGWHFLYNDGRERAEGQRSDWAMPSQVKVQLIGVATEDLKEGTVICASFNAG